MTSSVRFVISSSLFSFLPSQLAATPLRATTVVMASGILEAYTPMRRLGLWSNWLLNPAVARCFLNVSETRNMVGEVVRGKMVRDSASIPPPTPWNIMGRKILLNVLWRLLLTAVPTKAGRSVGKLVFLHCWTNLSHSVMCFPSAGYSII